MSRDQTTKYLSKIIFAHCTECNQDISTDDLYSLVCGNGNVCWICPECGDTVHTIRRTVLGKE